jgi:hypothetical protein
MEYGHSICDNIVDFVILRKYFMEESKVNIKNCLKDNCINKK